MKTRTIIISGIITSLFTPFVMSGEPDALVDIEPIPAHKSWQLEASSYLFFSGIDGTVASGGHSADFDFKFGDIFKQLDFAYAISASATYENKFSLLMDLEYIAISADGSPKGPLYDRAEFELDQVIFSLVGAWRVLNRPEGFIEVGGGFRYLYVGTDLKVSDSNGVNPTLKSGNDSNTFDGIVAVRAHYQLSPKWNLSLYGDIGAGDSDLTWQVYAGLGYAVSEKTSIYLGYRHLAYELSDGGASLDIALSGPQLGLVHRF